MRAKTADLYHAGEAHGITLRRESVSDLTSCFTGLGVASQSAAVMSSDIQLRLMLELGISLPVSITEFIR